MLKFSRASRPGRALASLPVFSPLPTLLATTSVAALLLGVPLPAHAAGISVTGNAASVDNPANTTVTSIIVNNANISGAVTNEGTVTPGKAVGRDEQGLREGLIRWQLTDFNFKSNA